MPLLTLSTIASSSDSPSDRYALANLFYIVYQSLWIELHWINVSKMLSRDQCFLEPGVEHLSMAESDEQLLHERWLIHVLLYKGVLIKNILAYRQASTTSLKLQCGLTNQVLCIPPLQTFFFFFFWCAVFQRWASKMSPPLLWAKMPMIFRTQCKWCNALLQNAVCCLLLVYHY